MAATSYYTHTRKSPTKSGKSRSASGWSQWADRWNRVRAMAQHPCPPGLNHSHGLQKTMSPTAIAAFEAFKRTTARRLPFPEKPVTSIFNAPPSGLVERLARAGVAA